MPCTPAPPIAARMDLQAIVTDTWNALADER
ncbi:MAG: hypothetical protein ACJA1G_001980, partial [Qipengyuania sp.]